MNETVKSTIRLFKSVVTATNNINKNIKEETLEHIYSKTIKHGFVLAPEVISSNLNNIDLLIQLVIEELGLTSESLNNTFHKSWNKVATASETQLMLEQYVHYFTVYGFEELGIYSEESVYVPHEKLELPKDKASVPLILIKPITKSELKKKVTHMLTSGIALKEDTIKDLFKITSILDLKDDFVNEIKNKEIKMLFYEDKNIVPNNNVEFLRYIVYNLTKSTLLIKDNKTINIIKTTLEQDKIKQELVKSLFRSYEKENDLKTLSNIFYRFKPLFLALRECVELRPTINKIRRLAIENHVPMEEDYLNTITTKLKNNKHIDIEILTKKLNDANIWRKIRLAYALNYRLNKDNKAIMYKIRNGTSYVKEFNENLFESKSTAGIYVAVYQQVLFSIIKDLKKNVDNKIILIPNHVSYALPSSEKSFTGMLPSGTSVKVDKDMIFGIHWYNNKTHRVDLDLSLINDKGEKIGWDGYYRNEDKTILFSGDVTDAPGPKGATELFRVLKNKPMSGIMYVNYYTYDENEPVDAHIVVAKETDSKEDLKKNYMIDQNKILCKAKTKIVEQQNILGLLKVEENKIIFYFNQTVADKGITVSSNRLSTLARQYMLDYYTNTISLRTLLDMAGAKIISSKESLSEKELELIAKDETMLIDLNPDKLEKDTFINLLS